MGVISSKRVKSIEEARSARSMSVNSFRKIPYIKNTPVTIGRPNQKTVIGDKTMLIGSNALNSNKISNEIPSTIIKGRAL